MFLNLTIKLARHQVKWIICDSCEGNGRVDNPAFAQGFTSSEWAEEDQEFKEGYLAGLYDVPCPDCRSAGKVLVPDMTKLSFAQKRQFAEHRRDARNRAQINREQEMERRMGA